MRFSTVLVLFSLVGAAAVSRGGPPLATGDVPTATRGVLEIYEGWQYQKNADGGKERATSTEFAFGVNDRLEANFEIPYLSAQSSHGWGDLTLGSKVVLITETRTGPGLAASVKWVAPTANAAEGLGRGVSAWNGRVRLQKSWRALTGIANLGYTTFSRPVDSPRKSREDPWFTAMAVEYRIVKGTALLAEIYWQTREKPGASNRVAYSLGFKQKICQGLRVHGAIGGSLRAHDEGGPALRIMVGLKYELVVNPKRRS